MRRADAIPASKNGALVHDPRSAYLQQLEHIRAAVENIYGH
jgi:hypothetical protein